MKNKILVYDDNCPLCSWYSMQFVKCGLLPAEGRKGFSTLEDSLLEKIDFDRGRNEIPLIDTSSGKILYGIDALLEILGQKTKVIKTIGHIKPVKWFLQKLYKFISYNRKVIVAKKCGTGLIDCAPDFNYRYRFLFMLVFLIFNTLMLFPIHAGILRGFPGFQLSVWEFQLSHFGLVLSNCLLALLFSRKNAIEYLGQVNILALMSILLLTPLLIITAIFQPEPWFLTLYLGFVAIIIFREYLRRMVYAGILPSRTWVAGINLACLMGFVLFVFN